MSVLTSTPTRTTPPVPPVQPPVDQLLDRLAGLLARHSVSVLRVSLGVVFLAFGFVKFFPGMSPAEPLAVATIEALTLGMVKGSSALLLTALTETVIGLTLVSGRFLRLGLLVLAGALVGIMSPLVLFPGQMWADGGPTLLGQYVFKDVVLVAGGLVVAAQALGARLRRD